MVPASLPMSHAPQQNGPVWQLWANDGPVPAVVRRCMESVRHHIGMRDHRILDAHTYSDYITLPPHIEAKREVMGWTHFSDVLRVNLLAEHGGIWLDATVMLTGPVPDEMGCLPFFAFTRPEDPFLLSSWCMQSAVGSALTVALAQMLDRYWAEHDELVDYFLLHFLFEAAVTGNRRLRAQWLEVPVHSHVPPHRLQDAFAEPFDEQRLTDLLRSSWIHKLTWKPPEAARRPGTLYSQLEAAAGYWPSSA